jgi:nucleotide-binding universal stress UspA family protein
MAKSILCAIDFSESSLHALKWAAELSSVFNCHLTVLYPYRLLQTTKGDEIDIKQKKTDQALAKFDELKRDYLSGKVSSYDFTPEIGFLSDRIDDHLRRNSIMMMVIGRSMNASNHETLQDLVSHVNVPVVVVP